MILYHWSGAQIYDGKNLRKKMTGPSGGETIWENLDEVVLWIEEHSEEITRKQEELVKIEDELVLLRENDIEIGTPGWKIDLPFSLKEQSKGIWIGDPQFETEMRIFVSPTEITLWASWSEWFLFKIIL